MVLKERYINPLEMPNFLKTEDELKTTYDKWLYVLKHLPNLESRPVTLQEKVFAKLFEVAEIAKFSSAEREEYEESLKSYRDLKNVIDTSKMEGKLEEKIEIALKAIEENLPVNVISRLTGLSEAEIQKLKK